MRVMPTIHVHDTIYLSEGPTENKENLRHAP